MPKKSGMETNSTNQGSSDSRVNDQNARYMPSIRNSPWAKFTTRMIPKIRVRPTAIRA